jgi:hypothetical protein
MPRTSTNPRFDDRHAANRLEATVRDLRDRLRYETGRERDDTLDDIDKIERQLSRMHC